MENIKEKKNKAPNKVGMIDFSWFANTWYLVVINDLWCFILLDK